jgi:hypoxanthine phosphoribosyltransferase
VTDGTRGTVVLDREQVATRVHELAADIERSHPDGVVLVGVLKGALIFTADLARAIQGIDVAVDFLATSRYAPDSGRVRILKDLDLDVTDRDVVLVDDLVDTGLTLAHLTGYLESRGPRGVEVCVLLDRAQARIVPLPLHHVGLEIPSDTFVVGYGLHVGHRYRNLPEVVAADASTLRRDPDAYAGWYGHGPKEPRGARC